MMFVARQAFTGGFAAKDQPTDKKTVRSRLVAQTEIVFKNMKG